MLLYSFLIGLNLVSISFSKVRFIAALSSGVLHLILGIIHIARLIKPFPFEIFNLEWLLAASLREIFIVVPFGILCLAVAIIVKKKNDS